MRPRRADDHAIAGLWVLLVDDSPDIVETLQLLLEEEGVRVTTATESQRGLVLAQEQDFDVILSDIGMPEMDGHECLRQARAAGFARHLNKPVSFEALIAVLHGPQASS